MASSAEMAKLVRDLLENSPGVTEINIDGYQVKINKDAIDYWERRAAREDGTRPISSSIKLTNG